MRMSWYLTEKASEYPLDHMAELRKGADRYMKKEMLQQVMTAPKKIEFRNVPVPEIGDDQVLVKIMKIGVCGSDAEVGGLLHRFPPFPHGRPQALPGSWRSTGSVLCRRRLRLTPLL